MLMNGLGVVRGVMSPFQELLKRGFDIVAATAGLVLLSPLIILVSLAIKLDSRGPVFCRLRYFDLNDAAFEAFEFRCWTSDSRDDVSNPTAKRDHNITWTGEILRRSGVDKVPQLVNVLRGDMSIVGPEPSATACHKVYRERIGPNLLRNVRPGVVSWAQVRDGGVKVNHSLDTFQRRIEDDCYYLANRSLVFDMKILVLALCLRNTQM
jgi:lipopolysaccharide/colanic/teichoic acid biosynthesis glycosyltransferase